MSRPTAGVQESNDEPQRRNTDAVEWFWGGAKASKGDSRGVVGEHLGTADARSSVGKGVVVPILALVKMPNVILYKR